MLIDSGKCCVWDRDIEDCISEHEVFTRYEERNHRASVLRKKGFKVETSDWNWNEGGRRSRYVVYWRYQNGTN